MSGADDGFPYDVALSFAGENRAYVERVAEELSKTKVRVFYDGYEQVNLWGKDLYSHLDAVYRKQARFCVLFVSSEYRSKVWTNHERRSAQARALEENREYILPVRLDSTELDGLPNTIGYIDARSTPPEELAELIVQKLRSEPAGGRLSPSEAAEVAELAQRGRVALDGAARHAEVIRLLQAQDAIGLRQLLKATGRELLETHQEWLNAARAKGPPDWVIPQSAQLEAWEPALSRFERDFGATIDGVLGVGLALAEFRREDLPPFLRALDQLRSASSSLSGYTAIEGAGSDVASAIGLQLAAGCLALGAYPSLGQVLTWLDVDEPIPWVIHPAFHHYRFFGTDAWVTPHLNGRLLADSSAWSAAVSDQKEALNYLVAVGAFTAVQAAATRTSSGRPFAWTFQWRHHRIRPFVQALRREPELAAALGAPLGEAAEEYRKNFIERYLAAHEEVASRAFFGEALGKGDLEKLLR
jgi:hypothetical protein